MTQQLSRSEIKPGINTDGLFVRYRGVGNESDNVYKITRVVALKEYGYQWIRCYHDGGKCGYGGWMVGAPDSLFTTYELRQ